MNAKIWVGAGCVGTAVVVLLGAFGVGADPVAELFVAKGGPSVLADNFSRFVGGLFAVLATILITWGYIDEIEGRPV